MSSDDPVQPDRPGTEAEAIDSTETSGSGEDPPTTPPVHEAATIQPQNRSPGDSHIAAPASFGSVLARPPEPVVPVLRRFGDYELVQEIARGGMGVVYKARQVRLNRMVAIKMILAGQLASHEDVQRFYTEAEAAANLHHPNIVAIHEVGECEGQHYFSMEFVQGRSLAALVRDRPLPPAKAAEYVRIIADAIHYAHQHGILHRDLKPSNILLDEFDQPRVTDFGLAKQIEGGSQLTASGAVVGTPSYMPPEQAAAKRGTVGPTSDVYSLGAILYELVVGRPPFDAATPLDTLLQVLESEPTPPRLLNHKVDRDLDTICLKCLRKDPRQRYASAQDLSDDLKRLALGQPIRARPVGQAERLWRWCRRNPAVAALIAFVSLTLVTVAVAASFSARKERGLRAAADEARLAAQLSAKESRSRLIRQLVANGVRLMDEPDLLGALPWFVEAWELDNDGENEPIHRFRLGAVLAQAPKPMRVWFHNDAVLDAEFSHDGRHVVTASQDRTAQVWDTETGEPVGTALEHGGQISHVVFSPDGSRVLTASDDGTARLWDSDTGEPHGPPLKHDGAVQHASFSPDGRHVVTASADKTARVWDAGTGEPVTPPIVHRYPVHHATFSPDQRLLATASGELKLGHFVAGEGGLWNANTGTPVGEPLPHDANVNFICFSPDSSLVVTTGDDHVAKVWYTATGQPALPILRHIDVVNHAAFSPDGHALATACDDGTARVWDAHTGELLAPPLRHSGRLRRVAFSPDGRKLGTASYAGTAHIWDILKGTPVIARLQHAGPVTHLAFSPQGHRMVTACADGTARVWDIAAAEPVPRTFRHAAEIRSIALSRDGRLIATASRDGTARVWDSATGQPLTEPLRHRGRVLSVSFSRDGARLVTASEDHTAQTWDIATSQPIGPALQHADSVTTAAFSPDGLGVVTTSMDNTARVWNVATGGPVTPPLVHRGPMGIAVYSPDGQLVATGSVDKTAQMWDAHSGEPIGAAIRLSHGVSHLAFSRDGGRLLVCWGQALGEGGGGAQVWDVRTHEPISPVFKHTHGVNHGSFDADGRRVVTASYDETARVWDVMTGDALTPPMKHGTIVNTAEFSGDGRRVLTASSDYSARVWDATTGEPITPPLRHNFWCMAALFSPDGRGVLTRSVDEAARLWELPFETRPVEEVRQLAELLAVRRVHGSGEVVKLEPHEFRAGWQSLVARSNLGFEPSTEQIVTWHTREARESLASKQWFGRAWHLTQLMALDPRRGDLLSDRARCFAELSQWRQAADDYAKAGALGSGGSDRSYQQCLLRLSDNDLATYRAICTGLLDAVGPGVDPVAANAVVWNCILAPDAVSDTGRLVALAEQAVAVAPKNYALLNTLGIACYRAGRYQDAVQRLNEAIEVQGQGGGASDWLFLALAHARLGHKAEASEWFVKAASWVDRETNEKTRGTLAARLPWEERAELNLFRREAALAFER